ncbi:Zinc finger BED domain-containing protein RICESLEEPER 1 [Bienertia sinuspersici]
MKFSNSKKRPIETLQQDDDEDDDVAVLDSSTPQHDEDKVGACRSLAILTAKSKSGTSHLKRHLDKFPTKNNITSPSDIPITTPTSSDRMNAYSSWMSRKEKFSMDKPQLDLYLEEKNVDHKSKFDVLAWWKNNGAPRHPQLAALARDILAIHISS